MASGSEPRLRTGGPQTPTPRPYHAEPGPRPKVPGTAGPNGTPGGTRTLLAPVRPTGSPGPRSTPTPTPTSTPTPGFHTALLSAANNLKPVGIRCPRTPETPATPAARPNGLSPTPVSTFRPPQGITTGLRIPVFQGTPRPPAQQHAKTPARAPPPRPTVARPSPRGRGAPRASAAPPTPPTPRNAGPDMSAVTPRPPAPSPAGRADDPPATPKVATPQVPETQKSNGPGRIELPKVFEPDKTEGSRDSGPGKVELPAVFGPSKNEVPRDPEPGKIETPKVFGLRKDRASREAEPGKIETPAAFRSGNVEAPGEQEPGKIEVPKVFGRSRGETARGPEPGKIETPKVFGSSKTEVHREPVPGKIETPKAFVPSAADTQAAAAAPGKLETPGVFGPSVADTPRALAFGRAVAPPTPTQAPPWPGSASKPDVPTPQPRAGEAAEPATAPEEGAATPATAAEIPSKLSWLWTRPAGLPDKPGSEACDGTPGKDAPEWEDGASAEAAERRGDEFDSLLSPSLPSTSPSASSLQSLLGSWPGGGGGGATGPDASGDSKESSRDKDSNRDSGVDTQAPGLQPEPPGSPEPQASAAQKLHLTAKELLETERTYVKRLSLLDEEFHKRLREEAEKGSFPVDVVSLVFSNLPSIHSFHRDFLLPELERRMQEWDTNPRIGDILQKLAPFLKMYGVYVKNFDNANKLVSTWSAQSPRFADIVLEIQHLEECGSLTLQNHMLGPVQRIPRYQMLLQDYLKRLAPDAADRPDAEKSLDLIATAATHSNTAIRRNEHMQSLLRVHELLSGEVTDIVRPDTELLKEGIILKRSVRIGIPQERYLFLFNNMLLHCVPKIWLMGQRYAVRTRINVKDLEVKDVNRHDQVPTFQVCGIQRTLDFQARTEEEKQEWMKAINEVIKTFREKEETFRGHKEEYVEGPVSPNPTAAQPLELGQRAPMWVRDANVTLCMSCQEPFTAITRRRHHCRACGKVVCWKCSEHRLPLAYEPGKLLRVCGGCHAQLREDARTHTAAVKNRNILQERSAEQATQESIICGSLQFLERGGRQGWARVWCVIPHSDPLVLYVYGAPQDVKALKTFPLPGYAVRPPEASDGVELRRALVLAQSQRRLGLAAETDEQLCAWTRALTLAAEGRVPDGDPRDPGNDESDSFSDHNDDSDGPEAGPNGAG